MMQDQDGAPETLSRPDGATLAYRRLAGRTPGVVFIHGYHSDMEGGKALAVEQWCREHGHAFLRFDLFGHGQSSGKVEDGTIGRWADDAEAAITQLTEGPVVLVGSSLGGWVSLLAALRLRDRVKGLVGIAAAPDFTEDLMFAGFTPEQKRDLMAKGVIEMPNCSWPEKPWIIRRALIEDGRNNLLLRDTINLHCPVRLLQGQKDADVPWQRALTLADCLASEDVAVELVKDGDHRLNRDQDIARLLRVVGELVEKADA